MINNRKFSIIFLIIILVVGVGLRVFYIYKLPFCMPDEDCATVGLMVSNILKGDIPLFFPGQAYMGSVEALWLSLFAAFLGMSTATLYLGMVSLFVFFSITIYWLGRILGGRFIGLLAMIYCSISPHFLFHESVVPYGYHMVLLIFGNLVLISSLILTAEQKPRNNFIWWAMLGFSAGIGFWIHLSIILYIIPAGFFLLLNKRVIDLVKNSITAIIFFIIGGLPFWIFNLSTHFSSFDLYSGRPYKHMDVYCAYFDTLKRVFDFHIANVLGIKDLGAVIKVLAWVIFCAMILLFILQPEGNGFKYHIKRILKSKKMILVFLLISTVLLFSSQKFFVSLTYSHYVMPIYSVIPILIAYSVSWLNKKLRYSGIVFLMIALIFNGYKIYKGTLFDIEGINILYKNLERGIRHLSAEGIDSFYSYFDVCQQIHYLTNNKILGAELFDGRIPNDVELQGRDKIAIHGLHQLAPAIKMICRDFRNDCGFYYGFKQYGYYGRPINNCDYYGVSNCNSEEVKYSFNRNLDRQWFISKERKIRAYYQLDLGRLRKIYRLVISPFSWDFPSTFRIKVSTNGIDWKTVQRTSNPQPLFWSGWRLYYDANYGRQEIIFKPVKARYVRIEENFKGIDWDINEIFIFEYLGEKEYKLKDYVKPAKRVYRYLVGEKIGFAYADFWLSAKIGKWSKDKIETLQVENICYPFRKYTSRIMKLNNNAAIVVDKEMQEETEKALSGFDISIRKKVVGDYVVFLFKDNTAKSDNWQDYFFKHEDSLYWAGICPIKISLKSYSQVLYSYGLKLAKEKDEDGAVSYYKKALKVYPRNNLAREAMINYYVKKKSVMEYKKELLKLKHLCCPMIRKRIEFENGVTFLGYRLFRHENILRIDYYWKTSKKLRDYTVVFVYFIKDDKIVFQGDYPLLFEYPNPLISLKDWVFIERSRVKIPLDAASGIYEIQIGLHMPDKNGMRVGTKKSHRTTKINIGEFNLSRTF